MHRSAGGLSSVFLSLAKFSIHQFIWILETSAIIVFLLSLYEIINNHDNQPEIECAFPSHRMRTVLCAIQTTILLTDHSVAHIKFAITVRLVRCKSVVIGAPTMVLGGFSGAQMSRAVVSLFARFLQLPIRSLCSI